MLGKKIQENLPKHAFLPIFNVQTFVQICRDGKNIHMKICTKRWTAENITNSPRKKEEIMIDYHAASHLKIQFAGQRNEKMRPQPCDRLEVRHFHPGVRFLRKILVASARSSTGRIAAMLHENLPEP